MKNFTCNQLAKGHMEQWLSTESFAPVYPTSIRGANDQRSGPGRR